MDGGLYIRDDVDKRLRDHLAIADTTPLIGALEKGTRGKEPRVGLAFGEITQGMAALGIRQRWILHNDHVCELFTKSMGKSNSASWGLGSSASVLRRMIWGFAMPRGLQDAPWPA